MKRTCRYSWQRQSWEGKLLTHEQSVRFAVMDTVARDRLIANIVADLHTKQMTTWRRTARFRKQA
jgi:hypothetical protein